MNTAEYLTQLIDCKADMKAAIEERGVTVSGGLSTYADAIRKIEGSDVAIEGFDYWFPNGTKFQTSKFDTAPLFDTSNFKSFYVMFMGCENLITVPSYNTSNVTSFAGAFYSCYNLENIGLLDFSNVESDGGCFLDCYKLTNMMGLINYGKKIIDPKLDLYDCKNLTHDSLMNIINNLYDRNKNNMTIGRLHFDYDVLDKLSDEEKAIATNKGWRII